MKQLYFRLFKALGYLPLPLLHGLAWVIGSGFILVNGRDYRVAKRNIDVCFPSLPSTSRHRLARKAVRRNVRSFIEIAYLWQRSRRKLTSLVGDATELCVLDEALAENKGCIILGIHIGSWEFVGYHIGWQAQNSCMYLPSRHGENINAFLINARARFGNRPIPATREGVREVFGALRRGEIVSILPDQSPAADSGMVFSQFFGETAATVTLPAKIARKTKAPAVFAYALYNPQTQKFDMHYKRLKGFGAQATLEADIQLMNDGIETIIRKHPADYLWSYKRFKRRPHSTTDFYASHH